MKRTKSVFRRILRIGLWLIAAAVLLIGLQFTLLAFPQVVMANSVESGTVLLYYDGDPDPSVEQLAAQTDRRLRESLFYDSTRIDWVFYFRDQGTYEFFVKLSLLPNLPQGFNLSIFNNSFVSGPTGRELSKATGGLPRFSIFEGDPAHIMAHEIGHDYIMDEIGRGTWLDLPHWKQEGLPEYIANTGVARKDTTISLWTRIGVLLDDRHWVNTQGWYRRDWDRIHYRAWLMVEYLLEERGLSLEELIDPAVTEGDTYRNMLGWYRSDET